MAFDEKLCGRVRTILEKAPGYTEKKMFGGVCFLINGNMCCGIVGPDLMLRVEKGNYERYLVQPHARPMTFTGREMKGMLFVGHAGVSTGPGLAKWVKRARSFALGLPPKDSGKQVISKKAPAGPSTAKASAKASAKKTSVKKVPAKPFVKKAPPKPLAKDAVPQFEGFSPKTFSFLRDLEKNNKKEWFDAHRAEYEAHYLEPAYAFIGAMGPQLVKHRPISYVPKVNGSLFRVNRDVRFSKDKTPYKAHIDLWFWEGETRSGATTGFFLRLAPTQLIMGAGVHAIDRDRLPKYRDAVVAERSGAKLARIIAGLETSGYSIGGTSRKTVPPGYDRNHRRASLLLHEGLFAELTMKIPPEARTSALVGFCSAHFKKMSTISSWLAENL